MALLAAFKRSSPRCTGQDDLAVGTPIASRDRTEIEGLIGFFVNTLVLRTGSPAIRVPELLGRVRETALDAYATRICRSSGWWRSWRPSPKSQKPAGRDSGS